MNLHGARALITGATGGIGHAIARSLAGQGAELVLSGRRVDVLEPLADELGARAIAADLADPAAIDRLLDEAGDLDVLVANAALPSSGTIDDFTVEEIDRALDVNLRAPILMARAVSRGMADRGRGHIVLIGSLAGLTASPQASLYHATKFGVRGFGLGLRQDLRPAGIGVSVIEIGFVREAGMFADSGASLPAGVRTVSPADVAAGVVRAVERDLAEVYVAPLEQRLGAALGSVLPQLSAAVQRRVGGEGIASEIVEGQRSKR